MTLPAGFLDRLREGTSLADIVGRYVVWDERKSNSSKGDYWAPCPFHEEKTASFHVDDEKGYYYCFGCHSKGDVIKFLQEKRGHSFLQAVRTLAYISGMDEELQPPIIGAEIEIPNLIEIKDLIVENFDQENFLEVGVLTGWLKEIRGHPRLLRSLGWGDPDYPSCVLDILVEMDEKKDGSIEKIHSYIARKFSDAVATVSEEVAFSAANRVLGYKFVRSRNDVIGVMMPFAQSFEPVYQAIKSSCESTPLEARRADEVWNNSVLVNDILELINHSAVVVCDLSGRNENVFYELGIAHAWGKPVIPITQNPDDIPFDLKHHRYLHYLNNDQGRKKLEADLTARLVGMLGERPLF